MADCSDIRCQAEEGHAQIKRDELMIKACNTKDSCEERKEQAGGFLQQTGEQVMNMAQGAADTVKNAVWIGSDTTKHN